MGAMGRNGRKALAPNTLNILPKLELAPIRMYLRMFAKTFRPSMTPLSRTIKSFSSKIRSADSLATSTAVSTEMLMSAAGRAAQRGRIVDARSHESNNVPLVAQDANDSLLVGGSETGEERCLLRCVGQ